MRPPRNAGFTWVEVIVGLAILAILAALALSAILGTTGKTSQRLLALSNMKQLHLATQQMALDGETIVDKRLCWPGDNGGSMALWATALVPAYMTTNDFAKLLSVQGRILPLGQLPLVNTNGIVVYAVKKNSDYPAVFLSSANLTGGPQGWKFDENSGLLQNKSCVVFRKGGDGAVLLPKQVVNTKVVGAWVPLCK